MVHHGPRGAASAGGARAQAGAAPAYCAGISAVGRWYGGKVEQALSSAPISVATIERRNNGRGRDIGDIRLILSMTGAQLCVAGAICTSWPVLSESPGLSITRSVAARPVVISTCVPKSR